MEPRPQSVVLMLADISGYTRFMLANQTAQVHAQMVITKLLEAMIRAVEIPIEVNKIEGDALFLYALKPEDPEAWEETRRAIGRKLPDFFEAFARAVVVGSEFALCSCPSCQNVDKLKLKIVVHSGEAVLHQVGRSLELSGLDVILAHRLLKNSVPSDEYVLMTEVAYREIEFPTDVKVVQGEERYEGLGSVATYTYLADGAAAPTPEKVAAMYADRGRAARLGVLTLFRGWFGQFRALRRPPPAGIYREVGELPDRPLVRAALMLRALLLTPLIVPIGTGIEVYRALARSTRASRRRRA